MSAKCMAMSLMVAVVSSLVPATPSADVIRAKYAANGAYLVVEVLDDALLHFEYSAVGSGPSTSDPIATSVMVAKSDFAGSSDQSISGNVVTCKAIRATIDPTSLCVALVERAQGRKLTQICPKDLAKDWKELTIERGSIQNLYGLGQQFQQLGSANGDWMGRIRKAQPEGQAQAHGNGFMPFGSAGMVGNVQIPVLYAVGQGSLNYALFLDNVYKQEWNFAADPFRVGMWGDQVRFFFMARPSLAELRTDYLDLTGRPPVPPRKAFGLWVSEFGYKNWETVDTLRQGLRGSHFPLDGFVLDLFWFGGVKADDPSSAMGRLDWDTSSTDGNDYNFPDPDGHIAQLAQDHVGLIAIEESYVSLNTPTYSAISNAQTPFAYARNAANECDPTSYRPVELSEWFGKAAMLDWSDPAVGPWIHANRRFPNLVAKGIVGHWTDLGEPEKYLGEACYDGVVPGLRQHGDTHNLYSFLWNRGIYEGYRDKNATVSRRPFILTRSGTSGIQRFGSGFWSGDIGSDLRLLATHLNAQLQMSLSGIDYYGSDVGGFRREGMPCYREEKTREYEAELYTQWLANSAWFDVPVRPHTDNTFLGGSFATSPHLVGAQASNLANIRQRYELIPYYYSLAYRAFLKGEPLVAPMVLYYQDDSATRTMGHEKLVGRDILVAAVASHGEYARNVYLPAGTWVNYHANEWIDSSGGWLNEVPVYRDGILRLPAFVRAGAIIPQMRVTEKTKDAFGHLDPSGVADDLVARVYPSSSFTSFVLYEDDGTTIAFDNDGKPIYKTRTTALDQQKVGASVIVRIGAAAGTYPGAATARQNEVHIFLRDRKALGVSLNGKKVPNADTESSFLAAESAAWFSRNDNVVLVRSGKLGVATAKKIIVKTTAASPRTSVHFVCNEGITQPGESIAVVGDVTELGGGSTAGARPLQPNIYFEYIHSPKGTCRAGPDKPTWSTVVADLVPARTIRWSCVKRDALGQELAKGPTNTFQTRSTSFSGTARGSL